MNSKKKYDESEALELVFKNASPSALGKAKYDQIWIYKRRYEKGQLGHKAITKLLAEFGFVRHEHVYYTKERKEME